MRKPLPAHLLALALCLVPTAASAEIYQWTDARGTRHFTERLDQVPAQQRAAAARRAEERKAAPTGTKLQTYGAPTEAPTSPSSQRASGRSLRIPFERYGNLMRVEATVNDRKTVPFLVDTGASGIALPESVVTQLGIPVREDTPRAFVRTANGVIEVAVVTLGAVELGGARVEGLQATVNPSLEIGLLGGSFFNNFVYGVDAAASVITLAPNAAIVSGLDESEWRRRFQHAREPLERLEAYLEETYIAREGRRRELEAHLAELRAELAQLESEANRAGVPKGWRR